MKIFQKSEKSEKSENSSKKWKCVISINYCGFYGITRKYKLKKKQNKVHNVQSSFDWYCTKH